MILGLGVDLTEVDRVRQLLERWGDHLVEKLMGEEEARSLPPERSQRSIALACAIAGKEAASKALGTGWSQGVQWRHVVVKLDPPPSIRLEGEAARLARRRGASPTGPLQVEVRGNIVVAEFRLVEEGA